MSHKDDNPGDAETRKVCRVTGRSVLSWQHVGNACRVSRSYEESRLVGGEAGGAVTVTEDLLAAWRVAWGLGLDGWWRVKSRTRESLWSISGTTTHCMSLLVTLPLSKIVELSVRLARVDNFLNFTFYWVDGFGRLASQARMAGETVC